jgi:hypothetical protein
MTKKIFLFLILFISPSFAKDNLYYTVAGGAALGVYEGGFLNYIDELLKTNRKVAPDKTPEITHMAGTSAGAYNSLLSLFSKCSLDKIDSIQANFYWKGWINLSVDDMYIKENVKPDQIFTTDGFPILKVLKAQWLKGFKKDCHMVVGMAVTRFQPSHVDVNEKITVPNMTEHVVVKITGRGSGIGPKIENFQFNHHSRRQLLLPFTDNSENNFELLKTSALASTSYPIAFPPRSIDHCQKKAEEPYFLCKGKKITQNFFVDGGVFDNSPILLSYDIAKELGINDKGRFVWINPHMVVFEEYLAEEEKRQKSFFDYMGTFIGNFVETSRTRDLSLVSSWHPEIKNKILNTSVSLPLMSKPLSAFVGFFEKDFRIFDFYAGMVDAHLFVESVKKQKLLYPENENSPEWNAFFCIKAVLDNPANITKYCNEKKVDRNILALIQTSIIELYNECSYRKTEPIKNTKHCIAAFNKKNPPEILPEAKNFNVWRKYEDEESIDYTFRLLKYFNFEFRDLQLKKDESNKGQFALRKKIGGIFSTYMASLPSSEQNILRRGGDTFLNQKIYYTPLESTKYVTLGRAIELGWNFKRVDFVYPSFLKLSTGLLFQGGYDLINGNRDVFAISPLIGTEYEFSFSNYKWQYFLGVKAGYQFSNGDGCSGTDKSGDPNIMVQCRGITILPYVGLSFLEIMRFHILYNWLPDYSFGRIRNNILIQLGVQF